MSSDEMTALFCIGMIAILGVAFGQCGAKRTGHAQGVCDQACHANARVLETHPDPLKCLCPNDRVVVIKAGAK